MTWKEVLNQAAAALTECGILEAAQDAWILLEEYAKVDRARYFLIQADEMPEDIRLAFEAAIQKRRQHIPVQQITGKQNFYGLEFRVNEHVLIPRQDTECLVEEALKRIHAGDRILDICTGSGCIIISIAKWMKDACRCFAVDISEEALKVAESNAKIHHADVTFWQGDLFEPVCGSFDCIISNPPYIESSEIRTLMPEVRDYEPILALDGKEDGLFFYRKIIKEAIEYLQPQGWLLFEIGCRQAEAVTELMTMAGYQNVTVKKDLAGLDRIVLGQMI